MAKRKKATPSRAGKTRPKATRKVAKKNVVKKKTAPKTIDPDAMMAAWQKAMTPSEGHRRLAPMVGSWKARTTFVMAPGAPPEVSEATSVHRWVLGGRYVEQVYRGISMGMPFEGIGFTGYDNVQRRYVGTWMDNFGTGLMTSVGTGRPREAAMDFLAESCDPSGAIVRFECKLRLRDRDHHTYEMWTKGPNGKRYRMMLIEYTRA